MHNEYRNYIVGILRQQSENHPETVCEIAAKNICYFDGITDDWSGDFYWFYANSLQRLGKPREAAHIFEKCYQVRKVLDGESAWLTALAKRGQAMAEFATSDGKKGWNYLLLFMENLTSGLYAGQAEQAYMELVEGETLHILLMAQRDEMDLHTYYSYLKRYERICEVYKGNEIPLLDFRMAWNFRGYYYWKSGDFIQAETAFLNALSIEASAASEEILSDARIKTNLLMIYYVQNDVENAVPLLLELLDLLEGEEEDTGLHPKDECRIYTLMIALAEQSMIEMDEEQVLILKSALEEISNLILTNENDIFDGAEETVILFLNTLLYLLQNEAVSEAEQDLCFNALLHIENSKETFSLNHMQKTILLWGKAILAWNLGREEAEECFQIVWKSADSGQIPASIKAGICQSLAVFCGKQGRKQEKINYLNQEMMILTDTWHSYVRYLNDERLIKILIPVHVMLLCAYAELRVEMKLSDAYEYLLQFKALASLAGRERNRVIHQNHLDQDLLEEIRRLQTEIAVLETEMIFRDVSSEYKDKQQYLRELEKKFAIQFPKENVFMNITWEHVKGAIPDNSAVVEYFFTIHNDGNAFLIDIYVTEKRNGDCFLNRVTAADGEKLMEMAKEFVSIQQAISSKQASVAQIDQMERLRIILYQALVLPVLPLVENEEILYIALDDELLNLPLEILYDESGMRLIDHHCIVKIECARDFLFWTFDKKASKGSLILGNPLYEVDKEEHNSEKKDSWDQKRFADLAAKEIKPLPFSELEVQKVARRTGETAVTGVRARKNVFLGAKGYENLHIATHGFFDTENETDHLYSSCLLFAGAKDWMRTGKVSADYGNGIVTADEVSRMNLQSVNLTVLSSCLSGMNDVIESKGFHGMVGAMSAAGVKYVISHLWNADDFAAAVFMDAFYYWYIEENEIPPIALSRAQEYLRNVTVGQLKEQGWFDAEISEQMDAASRKIYASIQNGNSRMKPFKNEAFWGGFACYRFN